MLERTIFGRRLKLYGDSPDAAYMTGAPTRRLVVMAFVISGRDGGLCRAVSGGLCRHRRQLDRARVRTGQHRGGGHRGAALSGGKGSVPGVLLAALILVSLFNIVVILGLSIELQLVIKGTLIILAAAVYMKRTRS